MTIQYDTFSETEQYIWANEEPERPVSLSDDEINDKYARGEERIVVEMNREKLPLFVESLKKREYIYVQPIYQRRATRWDVTRKSRLIESFIINVPVPPIFLYERDYSAFEVMDGQQRIQAIRQFYNNEYSLKGLQRWPELNGRTYATLPSKVRAGIDRRSISSIVLLRESSVGEEDAMLLRQLVFERLNTGGIRLERQEIRNAIDAGPFNDLLKELSKSDIFRRVWQLPKYSPDEEDNPPATLARSSFFGKMEDVEAILRFFALRHVSHYKRGMQGFLDLYMIKALKFSEDDIVFLRTLFLDTLNLAVGVYGDIAFHPYDTKKQVWTTRPHVAFWDAVMVTLSRYLDNRPILLERRQIIVEATKRLFLDSPPGAFTGRANTKQDVEGRIQSFFSMIESALV